MQCFDGGFDSHNVHKPASAKGKPSVLQIENRSSNLRVGIVARSTGVAPALSHKQDNESSILSLALSLLSMLDVRLTVDEK